MRKVRTFLQILRILLSVRISVLFALFSAEVSRRLYSNEVFYGLCYDDLDHIVVPASRTDVALDTLKDAHVSRLFLEDAGTFSRHDLRKALECHLLLGAGLPTGYVGVTSGEEPCVVCWLIASSHNVQLQSHFRQGSPMLKPDEVLCEHIFTRPGYRGQGLMEWLTLNLFRKAAQSGKQRVIAFVNSKNGCSLKGSAKIGWRPYLEKRVRWRWFRRRIDYAPISSSCLPQSVSHMLPLNLAAWRQTEYQ